jgi:hypothetical protein
LYQLPQILKLLLQVGEPLPNGHLLLEQGQLHLVERHFDSPALNRHDARYLEAALAMFMLALGSRYGTGRAQLAQHQLPGWSCC